LNSYPYLGKDTDKPQA